MSEALTETARRLLAKPELVQLDEVTRMAEAVLLLERIRNEERVEGDKLAEDIVRLLEGNDGQ